jgi:hypothetical protein
LPYAWSQHLKFAPCNAGLENSSAYGNPNDLVAAGDRRLCELAGVVAIADPGQDQSLHAKVLGVVAYLVIDQVGGLHKLIAALVRVMLESHEDANSGLLASPSAGTELLEVEMHIINLKTGTHC